MYFQDEVTVVCHHVNKVFTSDILEADMLHVPSVEDVTSRHSSPVDFRDLKTDEMQHRSDGKYQPAKPSGHIRLRSL